MGGKRSHRAVRCIGCRMHVTRCLCGVIPVLPSRVRFVFLVHPAERWKTTSSGRIAARAFSDAEVVEWVGRDRPFRPPVDLGDAAVLFPTDEARDPVPWVESVEARGRRPTIVVPDGTWPQCRKMIRKHHALNDLPRVTGLLVSYGMACFRRGLSEDGRNRNDLDACEDCP